MTGHEIESKNEERVLLDETPTMHETKDRRYVSSCYSPYAWRHGQLFVIVIRYK